MNDICKTCRECVLRPDEMIDGVCYLCMCEKDEKKAKRLAECKRKLIVVHGYSESQAIKFIKKNREKCD